MTEETRAERDGAQDIYRDGEVPGDADLNAPDAKDETPVDEAVKDIAESVKLDSDEQLPPGAPLP